MLRFKFTGPIKVALETVAWWPVLALGMLELPLAGAGGMVK